MLDAKRKIKLEFKPILLSDKARYEKLLFSESERGCEFTFANVYMWGEQNITEYEGNLLLFSKFGERYLYPYPLGDGDKRKVLDAIIADAAERGIPCYISGVGKTAKKTIEELYPERFRFDTREGSFDYVYSIDDLADLPGKKYHQKRTHINRFLEDFPNYRLLPITEDNIYKVRDMAEKWYKDRLLESPESDFDMEMAALDRALSSYGKLSFEGLMLLDGDRVLAFTIASRMSNDTFDVHFEKALSAARGAYPMINSSFAKYIREKYPEIRYLDREEDMGIEGLRKAKRSYHPHHMVEKWRASLIEKI